MRRCFCLSNKKNEYVNVTSVAFFGATLSDVKHDATLSYVNHDATLSYVNHDATLSDAMLSEATSNACQLSINHYKIPWKQQKDIPKATAEHRVTKYVIQNSFPSPDRLKSISIAEKDP